MKNERIELFIYVNVINKSTNDTPLLLSFVNLKQLMVYT